jgi:hypothetical protein
MEKSKELSELDFITQEKFLDLVEKYVKTKNISYMEAIVYVCEEIKLEYESVPKLINVKMKRLIKNEALSNNMLKKKKSARLPI